MLGRGNTSSAGSADEADCPYSENINNENINTRQNSVAAISGVSDRSVARNNNLRLSKINSLKVSMNKHSDVVAKILLTSKDTAEKRGQIESAFRFCREAFLEMANTLTCMIDEGSSERINNMKQAVRDALENMGVEGAYKAPFTQIKNMSSSIPKTYAAAAANGIPKVRISRGSSF